MWDMVQSAISREVRSVHSTEQVAFVEAFRWMVLARVLGYAPDTHARIAEITRRGMEGEISFRESLEARLRLARPYRRGSASMLRCLKA